MDQIGSLPTTLNPEENFQAIILGETFYMKQMWNATGFWTLSIADSNNVELVGGVKLVAGIFMLQQYPQVPFDLIIDGIVEPDRNNLTSLVVEVWSK